MELGKRLRQERVAQGLSQRQLCGDVITRNMLSQIENGVAKPSMDTLAYLANRLGKPIGFFLEDMMPSANQTVIIRARNAYGEKAWEQLRAALDEYSAPDLFDEEFYLLRECELLYRAEEAVKEDRRQFALELLEEAAIVEGKTIYGAPAWQEKRMCLQAKIAPETVQLPPEDERLLLLARQALLTGKAQRCEALLAACEEKNRTWWDLQGETALAQGRYAQAAEAFSVIEEPKLYGKLEECYRQLGDYKRAYEYACKQRK